MTITVSMAEAKALFTNATDWFLMTGLRNRFNLAHFVETGTAGGWTAKNAAVLFEHVWSMEIDPKLTGRAIERCRGLTNVHLFQGPSSKHLPHICRKLEANALFYLDAHWCGGERLGDSECPLIEEIKCIRTRWPKYRDVVVIDNAGMFLDPPPPPHRSEEWPTVGDIIETATEGFPELSIELLCDQIVISPEPLFVTLHPVPLFFDRR